uniref:Uncharacterized protein n=1 Tax=Meloidogyne incognita TaxID=6306 RepID=A0A914KX37_MELIC
MDVCDPEIIFNNYFSIMNVVDNLSVYQSISKCLPKCERDIIDTQLFSNKFQDQRSNVGAKNKKFHFHLEASYENLQVMFPHLFARMFFPFWVHPNLPQIYNFVQNDRIWDALVWFDSARRGASKHTRATLNEVILCGKLGLRRKFMKKN